MKPGLYERAVTALPPETPAPPDLPPCPACASPRGAPRFAIEGLPARLVVCADCGLGRLHPLPDEAEIRGFYPEAYYGEPGGKFGPLVEAGVRLVGARHVAFLSRHLPPGGRILDVGCGRGVVLGALADRGYEVHGFEISEVAARGADPRAKLRIAPDLSQARYPAAFFDQVLLWHVLEHLPSPAATLAEVRRVLRPGGRLIVAVPNFGSWQARWAGPCWFHLDPPRHLFHFTLPALRRLLERADFRVRTEHHFSLRQNPFGWVQSALNRRAGLPRNGLYVLLQSGGRGSPPPFDRATRWKLRLLYLLGMPLGLALAVLAAGLRTGATVHVVAEAADGGDELLAAGPAGGVS